ncbi:DUF6480 family protein [Pseudokineococcus marinus]|uniref:Uncharacterized protein n=1 Tax=Pseudokineococcus marinus TaxID=351215 RepID=A0A849BGC3_9ACTN|nr:DUF6480 family protein [Pseudokineococcus marinus]NNH22140.1 hypothetical protein [Pseudokineococcus marinus]
MTTPSADPDPSDTPGLEEGNGVRPGDTPPSEAGTSGLSSHEAKEPSGAVNKAIPIAIVALVFLFVLFLLVRAAWPS